MNLKKKKDVEEHFVLIYLIYIKKTKRGLFKYIICLLFKYIILIKSEIWRKNKKIVGKMFEKKKKSTNFRCLNERYYYKEDKKA